MPSRKALEGQEKNSYGGHQKNRRGDLMFGSQKKLIFVLAFYNAAWRRVLPPPRGWLLFLSACFIVCAIIQYV